MSSVDRFPDPTRGPRWRARTRTPEGQSRSRVFDKRADATRWLATLDGAAVAGAYVDPAAGRVSLRDYVDTRWLPAQVQHRATTTAQVRSHLQNHLLPALGDRAVASITRSDVEAFVRTLTVTLAPATIRVVMRWTAQVFLAAVEDRLVPASPCRRIALPQVVSREVVPLSPQQVQAMAAAMPERWAAAVILAATTGMRMGEVLGLTVGRVDFLRRTLLVAEQLQSVGQGEPRLVPLKTAASARRIPLPQVTLDALAQHLAAFPPTLQGLVFGNTARGPVRRGRFSEAVRVAADSAGCPEATFHTLRHTYASLLIDGGESVKVVQARLGHASPTETLATYAHLWPDTEDRTRLAVDRAFGATSGVTLVSRAAGLEA